MAQYSTRRFHSHSTQCAMVGNKVHKNYRALETLVVIASLMIANHQTNTYLKSLKRQIVEFSIFLVGPWSVFRRGGHFIGVTREFRRETNVIFPHSSHHVHHACLVFDKIWNAYCKDDPYIIKYDPNEQRPWKNSKRGHIYSRFLNLKVD